MDYGTLNALFFGVPMLIGFLILVHFFQHRQGRQPFKKETQESTIPHLGGLQRFFLMAVAYALMLASSVLVDGRWDDLRHTFNIPPRSIDALLIVGFANVGVFSLLLLILVIFVNLYDKAKKSLL